ncbi:MAG: S1C family serine protease [Lachnotalea sp.]
MSDSNNNEEFSFIREKFKDKPLNKRRIVLGALFCIVLAILFGSIASVTFVLTKPYFEQKLIKKEEPDKVSIPKDETSVDEVENTMAPVPDVETQEPEEVVEPMENTVVVPELELDDLVTLYKKINEVAKEADKFVVTVTGVTSNVDWFNDTVESTGQAAGIIVANNGQELLMLTKYSVINDVEKITVTFADGNTVEASAGKYDSNTQLAIVSVPLDNIDEATMDCISIASLGNSYASGKGDIIISLGSPLGYNDSVTYGMLTSTSKTVTTIDANYRVLTTDAVGSSKGSGAIINLAGEVIGFIAPEYNMDSSMGVVTALAISDLKTDIEKLLTNEDVVYFGIKGSDVTADIAEQQNLPMGVYVVETEMDSPAMNAGIQNGDVITKIEDTEIKTVRDLQNELGKYKENQVLSVVVKRQGMDEYKEIEFIVTLGAKN